MRERLTVRLAVGAFALLVASCTSKTQPQTDRATQEGASASVTAKADFSKDAKQRVTLYVEGMTKVQGIT